MLTLNQLLKKGKMIQLNSVPSSDRTGSTKVHLWMDSTNVHMTKHRSTSTKDKNWSYKENGPCQWFMVLADGQGMVQKLWGPYSPKLYDGDFLKLQAEEHLDLLHGCTIVNLNSVTHLAPLKA